VQKFLVAVVVPLALLVAQPATAADLNPTMDRALTLKAREIASAYGTLAYSTRCRLTSPRRAVCKVILPGVAAINEVDGPVTSTFIVVIQQRGRCAYIDSILRSTLRFSGQDCAPR
jgi:hypothetical protein